MFIDQDDYYHCDGVKRVYEVLKDRDLDILVNDSAFEYKGDYTEKLQLNFKCLDVVTIEDFLRLNGLAIAPWRLTIRREYYLEHNFSFEERCRMEDLDWGLKVMFYAKTIQYQPILLVHYIKSDSGTTDVMYKDKCVLLDNIKAGNRALIVANDLYLGYDSYPKVLAMIKMYYNFSCKYLLGLYLPIREKVDIINLIPNIELEPQFVFAKLARKYPVGYSIMSNISVLFFRLIRRVYRNIKKMRK